MEIDTKTKKNMAALGLILIAALGFRFVFIGGMQNKKLIASRMKEANDKIGLLTSLTSLNKEVSGYDKVLSKKMSQGSLTDKIASLSKGLDIKVMAVTPQPKDDFGDYTKLNMKLELEGAYFMLMQFLRRLEQEEVFIKVDSIEVKSSYLEGGRWSMAYGAEQPGPRRPEDSPPKITIMISALFKK